VVDEDYDAGFQAGYQKGLRDGYEQRLREEPYDHGEKANDPDPVPNVLRINEDDT